MKGNQTSLSLIQSTSHCFSLFLFSRFFLALLLSMSESQDSSSSEEEESEDESEDELNKQFLSLYEAVSLQKV